MKSISLIGLFLLFMISSQAQHSEVTLNFNDGTQEKRSVSIEQLLAYNKIQLETSQVIDLATVKSIELGVRIFEIKRVFVDLAQNQEDPSLLPEVYTPNIRDSLMILEKFVGGKISLYTTPLEGNTFYFVEKEGKSIVELRSYMTKRADGAVLKFEVFRKTLSDLTADCPQITIDQLRETRLFLKPLRNLVGLYNQGCGFVDFVAKKEKAKFKMNVGVFVGYAQSHVDFHSIQRFSSETRHVIGIARQSGYPLGLSLKIPVRVLFGKVWIETNHTVSRITGTADTVDAQLDPIYFYRWYYKTSFSFEANYFRNSFGLNVLLTDNVKVKPFIGGGIGLNFSTKFNSSAHHSGYTLDSFGNQTPIPEESTSGLSPGESLKKMTGSYYLNAGVSYSRFTLRYQFEGQPAITSGETFTKYKINRVTLGCYLLK